MKVEIVATPDPKMVADAFRDLGRDVRDFRPVWKEAEGDLRGSIRQAFESQGGSIGERWAPPAADYARRKVLDGHGSKPGVLTGKLSGAIANARARATRNRLTVGVLRVRHARAFNADRRFAAISRTAEERTLDAGHAHIERSLDKLQSKLESRVSLRVKS